MSSIPSTATCAMRSHQHLPLLLEPGMAVVTPSGREAEVVAVFEQDDEVLVRWAGGEQAVFRTHLLRRSK